MLPENRGAPRKNEKPGLCGCEKAIAFNAKQSAAKRADGLVTPEAHDMGE